MDTVFVYAALSIIKLFAIIYRTQRHKQVVCVVRNPADGIHWCQSERIISFSRAVIDC